MTMIPSGVVAIRLQNCIKIESEPFFDADHPATGVPFPRRSTVVGRKRHIAVDTDGRLLMVNLTPADISDSADAQTIVAAIRKRWPWLKHLFADGL